jgi:hypothetical protein
MHAFDTADILNATRVKKAGFDTVGIYLREDRSPGSEIESLLDAGFKLFSIWEKGNPTSVDYFSRDKGLADGHAAAAYAAKIKMPTKKPIFTCFDFDAPMSFVKGVGRLYQEAFREAVMDYGYIGDCYGKGLLCEAYVNAGIAHYGFLAQSKGWPGFNEFRNRAGIVQGPATHIAGYDVDLDYIQNVDVLWGR